MTFDQVKGSIRADDCFQDMKLESEAFMPDRAIKSPSEARAGSKEGVVRYVLAGSIALAVIAIIIGYVVS